MPQKLKDSHTSAGLEKEQFWFIQQRWTFSKNVSNFIVNANFVYIGAKNITICSMAEYKQYECVILAVVPLTFTKNNIPHFLNQININ